MATKSIQARLEVNSREELRYLWLTHRLFNESLPSLIIPIFKMKRGELGTKFKEIYDAIKDSQNSFQKLEPITTSKKGWKSKLCGTGRDEDRWADCASKINVAGEILFDRDRLPFAFGSEFWRKLCESAIARIHGHEELKGRWKNEHSDWLEEKGEWERNHPEFMQILPLFQAFEQEHGKIKKERTRWHKYLEFLRATPQLPSWRGKSEPVQDFSPEEERILRKKFFRKPAKLVEAFLARNPGLRALDGTYRSYLQYIMP